MSERVFVGFGFGPIQAGLFLFEAWRSRKFSRLVVAEIAPDMVAAVCANSGRYALNVAGIDGVRQHTIDGVEILNPRVGANRERLLEAVAAASEIATALPSVAAYDNIDNILATARDAVIYTAENHNHAAEILAAKLPPSTRVQCLNTVIGKMSGMLAEPGLEEIAPGLGRAFLVEEFNRILISRITLPGFERCLTTFEEKTDLLPFEEAKLYGHNATHALLGFLLKEKGATYLHETTAHPDLLRLAREAFLEESGAALCRKHRGVDPLFTPAGYRAYADDLMARMLNPHLRDAVARVTRDPRRKLAWDDRLVGVMRLALAHGIKPHRYALGAAAAVRCLAAEESTTTNALLETLWADHPERTSVVALIRQELDQSPCGVISPL